MAPVTVVARVAGQPLDFGAVHWWSESRPEWVGSGYTDNAGRKALGLVPGRAFKVRVEYPNTDGRSVGEAEGQITAEGVPVTITVDVPGAGSVSGVLRSRDGIALGAGNRTVAVHLAGEAQAYRSATPDAAGGFARRTCRWAPSACARAWPRARAKATGCSRRPTATWRSRAMARRWRRTP